MKTKTNTRVLLALTLSLLGGAATVGYTQNAALENEAENIALGKSVTFSVPPNYWLSTDPEDDKQLTDGQYSVRGPNGEADSTNSMWMQKGTVGWISARPIITIDLGTVQPISGIAYDTSAGRSGVEWPTSLPIMVSDDAKNWRYLGDLVELSAKHPETETEVEANFKYTTHDLRSKGRYVAVGVVSPSYIFIDEIEVYRGDAALLDAPAGGLPVTDFTELLMQNAVAQHTRRRLNADIVAMRAEVAAMDAPRQKTLNAQLDVLTQETKNLALPPSDSKAILPLNETHRKILALHTGVLRSQGVQPLTVWTQPRYAFLPMLAKPPKTASPSVSFSMLKDQRRSQALLLTNASDAPKTVALNLSATPNGAQNDWLQVASVEWTDTIDGVPVADALLPVTPKNDVYEVTIPAGMTRKIWLTLDSSKVPAETIESTLEVRDGATLSAVPLTATISKVAMPTPRFSMGVWDYTDGGGSSAGLTPKNIKGAIAMMRSHGVDTPWAAPAALPLPSAGDFDENGDLQNPLDFARFDQWVSMWPGARNYFVFVNLSGTFAGAEIGTLEYSQRFGAWAKALSSHMTQLKLKPEQLGLLLIDEPRNDEHDVMLSEMTKIINEAAPELTLFTDPNWVRPDQTKHQDAISNMDIIAPQLPIYKGGGEPVRDYYETLRASGKTLWLYQCTGPIRLYSPELYYRYNAWHAFEMGATGQGFWSFSDLSGAPTSWQSYLRSSVSFEPAFVDTDTVQSSLHWDAVYEGIEDYEELAMLRDAITAEKDPQRKAAAQSILTDAVSAVTGVWSKEYGWQKEANLELADTQLAKVRAMLMRLLD